MHRLVRMSFIKNRDSKLWEIYDSWSKKIGVFCASLFLSDVILKLTSIFEPSFPIIVQLIHGWLMIITPYCKTLLLAIIFLDSFKFACTKDPRDEPGRNWWSTKHAQRYLSSEIIIFPDNNPVERNESSSLLLCSFTNVDCPKCGVTHAFAVDCNETRICCFYGCEQIVSLLAD